MGKSTYHGGKKKMTALMFSSVSMTVSLVRVCLGGNLGTSSFNNPHTWVLLRLTTRRGRRLQSLRFACTFLGHGTRIQTLDLVMSSQVWFPQGLSWWPQLSVSKDYFFFSICILFVFFHKILDSSMVIWLKTWLALCLQFIWNYCSGLTCG